MKNATKPLTDDDMCRLASDQYDRTKARASGRTLTAEEWRALASYCTLVGNYVREDAQARRMHDMASDARARANAMEDEAEQRARNLRKRPRTVRS